MLSSVLCSPCDGAADAYQVIRDLLCFPHCSRSPALAQKLETSLLLSRELLLSLGNMILGSHIQLLTKWRLLGVGGRFREQNGVREEMLAMQSAT